MSACPLGTLMCQPAGGVLHAVKPAEAAWASYYLSATAHTFDTAAACAHSLAPV